MYRSPRVRASDRSSTSVPPRCARTLHASPTTALWSADFNNGDREENDVIDRTTPVDDANRRGRACPNTGNPTGGGAHQIAYSPWTKYPQIPPAVNPRSCGAHSYVNPRNPPYKCFCFANVLTSRHHQHEETLTPHAV